MNHKRYRSEYIFLGSAEWPTDPEFSTVSSCSMAYKGYKVGAGYKVRLYYEGILIKDPLLSKSAGTELAMKFAETMRRLAKADLEE